MSTRIYIFSLLSAVCLQSCSSQAQNTLKIGNTTVVVDTVISGIDIPWEILWGPDNHIWMTERKGIVSRVNPANGNKSVVLDLSGDVYQQSESGLLGMALHPDFQTTPEVFIVYTYRVSANTRERLVKYLYNGSSLVNPDTLIDGITGNTTHDGSRLIFLPDKTLLMTTGDAQAQATPQNLSALNGKVLRLNTDGSIPSDNPVPGSYIYSWGHRNAQGLVLAPNGKIYLSEHGPDTDDEFQLLLRGRNYGWPVVKGYCNLPAEATFCNDSNVVEPLMAWTPTIAPSDMVYYRNAAFPEFDSCILMCVLKDKKIIALKMGSDGNSVVKQTHYLSNAFGRLRDICIGPDNEIYLATNGSDWVNGNPNTHSIIRLTPEDKTSARRLQSNSGLSVYPNPASGSLNIDLRAVQGMGATLQLMDINGRICLEEQTASEQVQWSLAGLARGAYILKVIQDGRIISYTRVLN